MGFQRTQVYLDPAEHRHLVALAARRRISLAALVREIVSKFVAEAGGHHGEKGFSAICGIVDDTLPTGASTQEKDGREQALEKRYRQKLGIPLRVADSSKKKRRR